MEQVTPKASRLALPVARPASVLRKNSKRRAPKKRTSPLGAIVPIQATVRRVAAAVSDDAQAVLGVSEQEWVQVHAQEYAGKWVALIGSRLLAEGASAREVLRMAKDAGVETPFLVHVPETSELPFGGW